MKIIRSFLIVALTLVMTPAVASEDYRPVQTPDYADPDITVGIEQREVESEAVLKTGSTEITEAIEPTLSGPFGQLNGRFLDDANPTWSVQFYSLDDTESEQVTGIKKEDKFENKGIRGRLYYDVSPFQEFYWGASYDRIEKEQTRSGADYLSSEITASKLAIGSRYQARSDSLYYSVDGNVAYVASYDFTTRGNSPGNFTGTYSGETDGHAFELGLEVGTAFGEGLFGAEFSQSFHRIGGTDEQTMELNTNPINVKASDNDYDQTKLRFFYRF